MKNNMEALNGLIFSQGIMLKLTQKGVSREVAYKTVQKNALKTWKNGSSFHKNISKDKFISKHISLKELKLLFDVNYHKRYVKNIISRVLK